MPNFRYTALGQNGELLDGELTAESKQDAIAQLKTSGYMPIAADIAGQRSGWKPTRFAFGRAAQPTHQNVRLFTRKMATMLSAGLSIDACLTLLVRREANDGFRAIIEDIQRDLQSGVSFSEATEKHVGLFGAFYIGILRAGDAAGALDTVLSRLADHLDRKHELNRTIRSALTYPVILSLIGAITLGILVGIVIPNFEPVLAQSEAPLPLSTEIVLWVSSAIRHYWYAVFIGLGVLVLTIRHVMGLPTLKSRLHRLVLQTPLVGELITKIELSRYSRTLGTLLENGVSLLDGATVANDTLSNNTMKSLVQEASAHVKQGGRFSEPLAKSTHIPDIASELIQVGEETGQLEPMLLKLADIYEDDVKDLTSRLITILEPALIVVMGVIIGFVVTSILTAVMSMNDIAAF